MTNTSTLDRNEWAPRLDELTKEHEGQAISIEVVDPTYGDNREVEKLPFNYVNYDRKDDVLTIGVGGNSLRYPVVLRHLIFHPTEVDVADMAIRVIDKDETTTLVSFFAADASS
jgi:hypothetical protein